MRTLARILLIRQKGKTMEKIKYKSWRTLVQAYKVACISLVFVAIGCSTPTTHWDSINPAKVTANKNWSELKTGMNRTDFLGAMYSNGHRLFSFEESDGSIGRIYYFPFALFTLEKDSGVYKLQPTPKSSSCTYSPDSGGAYQSIFSISKARTKELFANSVAPLGFILNRNFPDAIESRSWLTLRTWWTSIEEMLSARFEETQNGTKVFINTESDLLALKMRDLSFAKSILEHMHCTYSLLSVERANSTAFEMNRKVQLADGQKLKLSNYRVVSSVGAKNGEAIELVVAEDVFSDGELAIRKGASAWGEIIKSSQDGAIILHINVTKVQAVNSRWYDLRLAEGPLVFKAANTPSPKLPEGSKIVWAQTQFVFPIGRIINAYIEL